MTSVASTSLYTLALVLLVAVHYSSGSPSSLLLAGKQQTADGLPPVQLVADQDQISNGQQQTTQPKVAKDLNSMLMASNKKVAHMEQQKLKEGFKRKWHKLVDELIESALATSVSNSKDEHDNNAIRRPSSMVNEPVARRRQPATSAQQQQQLEEQFEGQTSDTLSIVVKRKPANDLGQAQTIGSNNIDAPTNNNSNQEANSIQSPKRPQVSLTEHQRRIKIGRAHV